MSLRHLGLAGLALFAVLATLQCGSAPLDSPPPPVEREWVSSIVRDYDFADSRIFDLGLPGDLEPGDVITNLHIFSQRGAQNDSESRVAYMVVDPDNPDAFPGERVAGIRAKQMDPSEDGYELVDNDPGKAPYVVFDSSNRLWDIGVWYQYVPIGSTDTVTVGNIEADTLVLKLLKPPTPNPSHQTWSLMWRNCYDVGRNRTLHDDIQISVWRGLPGREDSTDAIQIQEDATTGAGQSYIEILGLDQFTPAGRRFSDGRVDDLMEIWRPDWGLLIFPHRTPFDTDTTFADSLGTVTQQLQDKVPELYNLLYRDADRVRASEYFIRVNLLVP